MIPKFIINVGQKQLALRRREGIVEIGGRCRNNGIALARSILGGCWWLRDEVMKSDVVTIRLHHQNQFFRARLSPVDEELWDRGISKLRATYSVTQVKSLGRLLR